MSIEEFSYCNVGERAEMLGLNSPTGLAVLPRNFEEAESMEDLLNESSAVTVRKLWKQAGLDVTPLEKSGDKIPEIQENEFALLMPVLFIGYSLWSQNPTAVSVALNIASNYIYDFFKGIGGEKKVELDVVIEITPKKEYRRLTYKGPPPGDLAELRKLVEKVTNNGR